MSEPSAPLPTQAPAPAPVQRAWQSALAAEHQAIFGYDLLGPRLPAARQALAHRSQDAHRAVRDAVEAAMAAAGLTSVAPLADYPALYPVTDAAAALRVAVHLEDACAAAWRYLYLQVASPATATPAPASPAPASPTATSLPPRRLRGTAQLQLTESAVRATRWRTIATPARSTVAFPGL